MVNQRGEDKLKPTEQVDHLDEEFTFGKVKSFIWITHSFEGFHCYPNAPDEVSYLREKHRHIFHLKVWIEVFHDDRDVEFHMFKNFIKSIITENDFDYKSCEMISDILFDVINANYPKRDIKIEVSEDGECGSFNEYRGV
jgi:hypothetical protein